MSVLNAKTAMVRIFNPVYHCGSCGNSMRLFKNQFGIAVKMDCMNNKCVHRGLTFKAPSPFIEVEQAVD